MFTQAVIHYPADEKTMKQIRKDIAAFHCAAAVDYMGGILKLNNRQKVTLINSLAADLAAAQQQSA